MAASWLANAVFYQIYPQSFCDSNGDGIGDLAGIESKLDYLGALGINAIWINPFYASPFRDAGYDIVDHCRIDDRYGTLADFDRLIEGARARGIRVCLDLVPSNTSDQHPWFEASRRAERNASSDRYVWTDNPWTTADADLTFMRGNSDRMGAYAVNFFAHQPALNYGFASVRRGWQQSVDAPGPQSTRAALRDIMAYWLDRGIAGFRVSLAATLVKADADKIAVRELWREIAQWLRERHPEAVLISEWGQPELAIDAGFDVDCMQHAGIAGYDALRLGPTTFPPRPAPPYFEAEGRGDFARFYQAFVFQNERVAGRGFVGLPTGNHDMSRPSLERSDADLKVFFTFLLTWPAVPFIYYGDEIGLRYRRGLPSKEGGFERTGSRTPMQWSDGTHAGFCAAETALPYLPLDPDAARPTVAAQRADKESLWHHVERLIYLRVTESDLAADAPLAVLDAGDSGYPLVYQRGQGLIVAINPGPGTHRHRLVHVGDVTTLLSHHCDLHRDPQGWWLRVSPRSFGVFAAR